MQRTVRDERYRYIRNYMPHLPYGQHMALHVAAARLPGVGAGCTSTGGSRGAGARSGTRSRPRSSTTSSATRTRSRNLAGDAAASRRARAGCARRWTSTSLATNDNGFIPEGSPLEGYDESRAPGAYPIRRVLRVAGKAIERDPGNLGDAGRLARRRQRGRPLLGGAGLADARRRRGAGRGRSAAREDVTPRRRSGSWVAEALARLGHTWQPRRLPGRDDRHARERPRAAALNALTYVGAAALPYMAVVDRAASATSTSTTPAGTCSSS